MNTRWISLQKTDTGHVFARTHGAPSNWEWASSVVAHEFDCDVDDLDLTEDDDGDEFITVRGEIAVQVHHAYVRNAAEVVAARKAA